METSGTQPVADAVSTHEAGQPARILLVVSEPKLARLAPQCLRFAGYPTEHARTGAEALAVAARTRPDLLIVDADCLGGRGAELVDQLRVRMGVDAPALLLAEPADVNAGTIAMTIRGDRYLAKPFSPDDLLAQVRALLRHATGSARYGAAVLRFADIELDEDSLEVRRNDRSVTLTPHERRILRYLLVNAGRTVTRAEIVEHVWPYNHGGHRRVLDVHMSNLRRKINHAGRPLIHTVHGIGFLLGAPGAKR